jgi:hypothetical protein
MLRATVAADQVEHGVDARAAVLGGRRGGHVVGAVVERDVGAERPQRVLAAGTRGRQNPGAERLGELHGEGADAARARVDEDRLAGPQGEPAHDRLPGRAAGQRNGRGLLVRQGRRLARDDPGGRDQELGIRPVRVAEDLGSQPHLVADREVADARPERFHGAGRVIAEHRRQRDLRPPSRLADLGVDGVGARHVHPHQHLAAVRRRPRGLAEPKDVRRAVGVQQGRLHGLTHGP